MSRWLFKKVRKWTDPLDFDRAAKMKQRLALAYGFIAWNAFGYICYMYYKGRGDWAKEAGLKSDDDEKLPASVQFAKVLGIEKATVKRIRGFEKVDEYTIDTTTIPKETVK